MTYKCWKCGKECEEWIMLSTCRECLFGLIMADRAIVFKAEIDSIIKEREVSKEEKEL